MQHNLNQFINQQQEGIGIQNNEQQIRQVGFLKKQYMSWQTHLQTLFQFKEIYTDRLLSLRPVFNRSSNKTIEDLSNDEKICELVGLFKRIQAKRVRAFEPDYQQKYKFNKPLYSQQDTYELEDQTSKIKLEIKNSTKINGSHKFVPLETPYGVIIKCNGDYSAKLNKFIVSNVETPKPAPQKKMILPEGEPKFMGVYCQPSINELRFIYEQILKRPLQKKTLNICQLVIIGGIDLSSVHQSAEYDDLLYQIGSLIDVFIVPSSCQETNHIYPLNPLPRTLLKKCYDYRNCMNCTNPQLIESKIQDIKLDIFVSCGENLLNLKANCSIKDDLELMKMIIEYRHVCPSSVFSLPIFSYKFDPLVMKETPHLMIHGKCQKFQTQFWERKWQNKSVKVRLVGLAKGDFVRIDLSSNELQTIEWQLPIKVQRMQTQ